MVFFWPLSAVVVLPLALLAYLRRADLLRLVLVPRWTKPALQPHDTARGAGGPTHTAVKLPVEKECEVIRDEYGVPHIYASNERDCFLLHGFSQAQDRLFQMEGLR